MLLLLPMSKIYIFFSIYFFISSIKLLTLLKFIFTYLFSFPNNLSISKSLGISVLSENNSYGNFFNSSSSLSVRSNRSIIFVNSVVLSGGAKVLALLSLFFTS